MNLQFGSVDLVGGDDGAIAVRLGRWAEHAEPHHDFVLGAGAVLRLLLVAVEEHIDGDVGVDVIGGQFGLVGGGCNLVADAVGPVDVEVEFLHVVEADGQHLVHHDVGESIHRIGLWARVELPCDGEVGGGIFGWVSHVVECGDLLGDAISKSYRGNKSLVS